MRNSSQASGSCDFEESYRRDLIFIWRQLFDFRRPAGAISIERSSAAYPRSALTEQSPYADMQEKHPIHYSGDHTAGSRRHPERRSCVRVPVADSMISVEIASDYVVVAIDIAEDGVGVRAFPDLVLGSRVQLRFFLPDEGGAIESSGTVIWAEESSWKTGSGRAGICFSKLARQDRERIEKWKRAQLKQVMAAAALERDSGKVTLSLVTPVAEPPTPPGKKILAEIVEEARTKAQADGAAIALQQGNEFLCVASTGLAPTVDTRLSPDSGLSGECVRTGSPVRCNDARNDVRIAPGTAQSMNLGSVLIIPVRRGEEIIGVLELFSTTTHAFDEDDLRSMQDLAVRIEKLARSAPSAHL